MIIVAKSKALTMFVVHSRRSAKKRQSASTHDTQENTSSWWWWQHTLFLNLVILCYVWTQNNGFLWDILGFSFCNLVSIRKIKAMLLVFIKFVDMAMLGGGRFSFCKLVTIKKMKAMLLVFIRIIDIAMLEEVSFGIMLYFSMESNVKRLWIRYDSLCMVLGR